MAAGTDLLTFIFNGPSEADEQAPIYVDAENPARSLSKSQTRLLVRGLIAGFQAAGVKKGECVLVVLANDVCGGTLSYSMRLLSLP